MPKPHRGKGIKSKDGSRPRGRCPVCQRTGIKLLYKDVEVPLGQAQGIPNSPTQLAQDHDVQE